MSSYNTNKYNSNNHYFKSEQQHKRQKSMYNEKQEPDSIYYQQYPVKSYQIPDIRSVSRINESMIDQDCDANISEFHNDLEINMQKQTFDQRSEYHSGKHTVIELKTIQDELKKGNILNKSQQIKSAFSKINSKAKNTSDIYKSKAGRNKNSQFGPRPSKNKT